MSALSPEADIFIVGINVCYVPIADIDALVCGGEGVQVTGAQSVQNGRDVSVGFDCGANRAGSRSMAKQDRPVEPVVANDKLHVGLGAFIFVDYEFVLAVVSLDPAAG